MDAGVAEVGGEARGLARGIAPSRPRPFSTSSLSEWTLDREPRANNNIDFVVDLLLERIDAMVSNLGSDFMIDRDIMQEAVRRRLSANAYYLPLVTNVEFFVAIAGEEADF